MPRSSKSLAKGRNNKFYAVLKGRQTGIFSNYEECEPQVKRFSGAVYKSFQTRTLAEEWLRGFGDAEAEVENTRARLSKLYPEPVRTNKSSNHNVTKGEQGAGAYRPSSIPSPSNESPPLQIENVRHQDQKEQVRAISWSHPAPSEAATKTTQKLVDINDHSDDNLAVGQFDQEALENEYSEDGIESPSTELSSDQERVLKLVLQRHNVFFTGPAGSGKSLILNHIKYHLSKRKIKFAVTAPTGIAAVLIGGTTIHSWSRVGKGDRGILEYLGRERNKRKTESIEVPQVNLWNDAEVLIIDEVSMLSPDLFETLNEIAKASCFPGINHENLQPFAGTQLVVCGDFFQLPPVDKESDKNCYKCGLPVIPSSDRRYISKYSNILKEIDFLSHIHAVGVDPERWTICDRSLPRRGIKYCGHLWNDSMRYCFQTPTWSKINFRTVLLTKVFRQSDEKWIDMLGKIKMGETSGEILGFLDALKRPLGILESGIKPTMLYSHRQTVDGENEQEFRKLKGQMYNFNAVDQGYISEESRLSIRDLTEEELQEHHFFRDHPTPKVVRLKHDAQVMLLSNISPPRSLVNGSRGVISGFIFHTLENLLGTAHWLCGHQKLQPGYHDSLTSYFNICSINGLVRIPLVKFVRDQVPYPILPVTWDARIPQFFTHPNGGQGLTMVTVKRTQIPLMLAWATTIHKSQGRSLDYVKVDVSRAFAPGQAYVGLSRCTSPEGMQILGGDRGLKRAIMADPGVLAFDRIMQMEFARGCIDAERVEEEEGIKIEGASASMKGGKGEEGDG